MIIIKTENKNKIRSFIREKDIFNKNFFKILKSKLKNKLYVKIKEYNIPRQ